MRSENGRYNRKYQRENESENLIVSVFNHKEKLSIYIWKSWSDKHTPAFSPCIGKTVRDLVSNYYKHFRNRGFIHVFN